MAKLRKIDMMLFRMIKNSKGQFVATLLIIVVGICIFTSLSMTAVNMRTTVDTYYEENHFADLFIETAPLPSEKIQDIENIDGVIKAAGRISIDLPMIVESMDESVTLRVITMKMEQGEINESTIIEGKNISDKGNETLLLQQFAEARGIKIGDKIQVQAKGVQYTLDVVGIAANPEYIYLMKEGQSLIADEKDFGVCYVSEKLGQQMVGLLGSYNGVLVSFDNAVDQDELIDDIEDELDAYGIKQTIKRENQLSHSIIQQELKQLNTMAKSLPILFLLIAALILMMMLGRMVKKDRVKIGLLKGMGYPSKQVLLHYVKYALICGITGGMLGSICGMALAGAMTKLYLQYFHIPLLKIEFYYSYIIVAILLSAVFCTLSGIIGARGVLRISPVEAMRPESPKLGKRIFLERMPFIWKNLSFSNKMVYKNIFRNKKRTFFVLLGVILTYGMMLFTTSMTTVMDQIMDKHFLEFQKMDYNISFQVPVNVNSLQDMKHIIDLDYIEGKIEYPFELSNGNKKEAVSIIGLQRDTSFYSFRDKKDNSISVPGKGILISENLAKLLKLEKGDMVCIDSYLPGRDNVYVQVKGIIKQSLGMNAYMEINNMGELLLEKNIINGAYVNSSDENINEELIHASNVASVMSTADIRAVYDEFMKMMVLYISFMVALSGLLGFCIVYNATIVSLGEREMEFSSLRVMGFSKREIFMMILKENNIIMIVGIIMGLPTGKAFLEYSSATFSTDLYNLEMTPTFMAAVLAGVYTIGFIIVAQLATYRKINKLDYLKALKSRES